MSAVDIISQIRKQEVYHLLNTFYYENATTVITFSEFFSVIYVAISEGMITYFSFARRKNANRTPK